MGITESVAPSSRRSKRYAASSAFAFNETESELSGTNTRNNYAASYVPSEMLDSEHTESDSSTKNDDSELGSLEDSQVTQQSQPLKKKANSLFSAFEATV